MNNDRPIHQTLDERQIASMFNQLASRYDFLNRLLSAGQDQRWRRYLIRRLSLAQDSVYLDVATGTGDLLILAAQAYPQCQFIGVDISANMLEVAERKVASLTKASGIAFDFRLMSASDLRLKNQSVDALSIAFGLRNVTEKEKALAEFYRVLKPGGKLHILEFFQPKGGRLASWFARYFHKILPIIGGFFSDRKAYEYLPRSVAAFYSFPELKEHLGKVGFVYRHERKFIFGYCAYLEVQKPNA